MTFTLKKYTLVIIFLSLVGSANLCAMDNVASSSDAVLPRQSVFMGDGLNVISGNVYVGGDEQRDRRAAEASQGPFAQRFGNFALIGVEDGFRQGVQRFTMDLTHDVLSLALDRIVRSGSTIVRYVAGTGENKDPADVRLVELKKAVLKLRRAKEGLVVNKILLQELEESDQLLGSEDEESSEELQKQKEDFVRQQKILAQEEQVLRAQIQEAKKKFEFQAGA